jgi:surface protein
MKKLCLTLFTIGLSVMVLGTNVTYAANKMDILFGDGRVLPYEEVKVYSEQIEQETFQFDGNYKQTRDIIGDDDREDVSNVLESPYRRVVRVHINFPDTKGQGSGAFISDDTILTSAHNLYNSKYGGWATSVSVYVMGEGNRYIKAKEFAVPRDWTETNGPINHDIGVIKLEEPLGLKNGWFGLSQENKLGIPITLTGFHGDNPWTMKTESGTITELSTHHFSYLLDAIAGSSGSPVYNNNGQIVGVNGYGNQNNNTAINTKGEHYNFAHYLAFEGKIQSFKMSSNELKLKTGDSYQLKVDILPEREAYQKITWSSSDSDIATVDESGKILANQSGNVVITARTLDGKHEAACEVKVIDEEGFFGTVPWEWDANTQTLTFKSGKFPSTTHLNNIRKSIENSIIIGKKGIKHIVFEESIIADSTSPYLFSDLVYLETIKGIEKLDVSNVTNMNGMFNEASSLTSLDLSNWDTSRVTDMTSMFKGTSSLNSLDISTWDTNQVTNMSYMFKGTSSLNSLDISTWDISQVTNMYAMFSGAENLKSLNLNDWNTSNVKTMNHMFSRARNLTSIENSKWNVSNVTDMNGMFNEALSLKELDISSWDMRNVVDNNNMFFWAWNLKKIKLGKYSNINKTNIYQHRYGSNKGTYAWFKDGELKYLTSEEFMENYNGEEQGIYTLEIHYY